MKSSEEFTSVRSDAPAVDTYRCSSVDFGCARRRHVARRHRWSCSFISTVVDVPLCSSSVASLHCRARARVHVICERANSVGVHFSRRFTRTWTYDKLRVKRRSSRRESQVDRSVSSVISMISRRLSIRCLKMVIFFRSFRVFILLSTRADARPCFVISALSPTGRP